MRGGTRVISGKPVRRAKGKEADAELCRSLEQAASSSPLRTGA